jgi:hypothetical protein
LSANRIKTPVSRIYKITSGKRLAVGNTPRQEGAA